MVYLLGSDVHAAITTENRLLGISVVPESGSAYVDNVLIGTVGSVNASTDVITTEAVHGLSTGDPIMFTMDDDESIMQGLRPNTRYFAVVASTTTFKVATSYANATAGSPTVIDLTDVSATETNITRELSEANALAATGQVSITVASIGVIGQGDVISLVATNGTTVTCTLLGTSGSPTSSTTDGNVTALTYSSGGYANTTLHATAQAAAIATAINYNNYFSASANANVITITQATAGADGNTTITITELGSTAMTKTNFQGGQDSGKATTGTVIYNREHPKYNGTGRLDTIVSGGGLTAEGIEESNASHKNTITDLTGVDITIGTVDEDVSYFGQKSNLKTEIKKDVSISFTRKKSDSRYEILWNKARCGTVAYTNSGKTILDIDGATPLAASTLPNNNTVELYNADAAEETPSRNYGYRIHLMLKSGTEVMTLQNCCMTSYATSVNADGITEETIAFYGYITPQVVAAAVGYVTATTAAEL